MFPILSGYASGEVNATKFTHLNGECASLKETNSVFLLNESTLEEEFFNKSNDIVNDEDFETLYNWTMKNSFAAKRFNTDDNPLARDLLRTLLHSPATQRQPNMDAVLEIAMLLSWSRLKII